MDAEKQLFLICWFG